MKKLNLINAEEARKVKGGGGPGIPPCKTVDLRCCVYDFFPGPGCGTRDLIIVDKPIKDIIDF